MNSQNSRGNGRSNNNQTKNTEYQSAPEYRNAERQPHRQERYNGSAHTGVGRPASGMRSAPTSGMRNATPAGANTGGAQNRQYSPRRKPENLRAPYKTSPLSFKKLKHIWYGKDRTELFYEEDIEANRICSAAAASGLLFFVPLTASPYSKYGRYWANQGVIMLVVMLASAIVSLAVGGILSLFGAIPYIGIVFRVIKIIFLSLLWLANIALIVRGCYYAAKGSARDFPLIGYMKIISYR